MPISAAASPRHPFPPDSKTSSTSTNMLKNAIRSVVRRLGYRITTIETPKKTVHSKELEFYKTLTGSYYLPKHAHGDLIAQAIIGDRIFEEEIVNIGRTFIKEGTTVLDVGSNYGQMAIQFSKMVGENGRVHAFEADDFIFSLLDKNVAANRCGNIETHFGAVHNTAGGVLHFPVQDFERFGSYGSYGVDYKNGRGRAVKTLTIDSLNIEDPISFMKIDVQGGDLFVLEGARKTILRHKMPILFEYEYVFEEELGFNFQQYVDLVAEIGYKFAKVVNQNYLILPK